MCQVKSHLRLALYQPFFAKCWSDMHLRSAIQMAVHSVCCGHIEYSNVHLHQNLCQPDSFRVTLFRCHIEDLRCIETCPVSKRHAQVQ